MPNLDRVNLCYDFLRANDTFTLSEFIQATSYSTSTAEKYLGSQLALYVQKNAGNYTILRNLPERDNFRKHFKQTSRIKNNEISILIDKSKNSALSAIAHYNSPYIPKSSSKERSSDVSVEYINIDELSEEQKKEIERNIIAVREKTVLEHLPQKFADAIKQKIEKVSSKKISSYIASYHLSTLMKKLGWKSNKEYRTTNKTYGRDYYTEKARVELFKKIDEDYESIVRLSNAHFVE